MSKGFHETDAAKTLEGEGYDGEGMVDSGTTKPTTLGEKQAVVDKSSLSENSV